MSPAWTGVVLPVTVSGHEQEGTEVGPSLKSLRSAKPAVASIATPTAVVIAILRVRRNVVPAVDESRWAMIAVDRACSVPAAMDGDDLRAEVVAQVADDLVPAAQAERPTFGLLIRWLTNVFQDW